MLEWTTARLAAVGGVEEILVAAGNAEIQAISPRTEVPVSVIADGAGSGPAAGVLGAAHARPGRGLVVLACDLPLVPVALVATLAASQADLAAASSEPANPQAMNPTCALWKPPALKLLERRISTGDFRLYPTLQHLGLRVRAIDAGRFGDPKRVLLNVNTAADWASARRAFCYRRSASDWAVWHAAQGQSLRSRSNR